MLVLTTADKIEVERSSTANVDCSGHYVDTTANTPGLAVATFNTAATGDLIAAPAADQRLVKSIYICNRHASTANTVKVKLDKSATEYVLCTATLEAGDTLIYDDSGWYILSATGTRSAGGGAGGVSLSADNSWTGSQSFGDGFAWAGVISPASIGSDQNNYNPTNLDTCCVIRQDASANVSLTGLTAPTTHASGRVIVFINISAYRITLKHESASSTAANRFANPKESAGSSGDAGSDGRDIWLFPNDSVVLWYDNTSTRWRIAAHNQRVGSGANVCKASAQSINTGTWTAITFDTERFDSDNYHDNATNNTRFTIPVAGRYVLSANIAFAANATGLRGLRFFKNGTTIIAFEQVNAVTTGDYTSLVCTRHYEFAAGDYVTCDAYQGSGGALNVTNAGIGDSGLEFTIFRVD